MPNKISRKGSHIREISGFRSEIMKESKILQMCKITETESSFRNHYIIIADHIAVTTKQT